MSSMQSKHALLTLSVTLWSLLSHHDHVLSQAHADEIVLTFEPVAAASWGKMLNNWVSPVHFGPVTDQALQCLIGVMAPYPPAKVSPSNIWDYYAFCNSHYERQGLIWLWLISLMFSFQTLGSKNRQLILDIKKDPITHTPTRVSAWT